MKKLVVFLSSILLLSFGHSDACAQWQPVPTGFPYPNHLILAVDVVNENVIWAATDTTVFGSFSSRILRTTNGGVTWEVHSFPGSAYRFTLDLDAIDANTAWIATNEFNAGGGGIYGTTDGGQTWTLQRNVASVYVHFFDALNGVSVNGQDILTSTDAGTTWNPVNGVPPYFPNEYNIVNAGNNTRAAYGDTIWIPTTQGRVYRSTNRGYSWTAAQTSLGRNACITSVAFRDGKNGLAVSSLDSNFSYSTNIVARTTDGGITWTTLPPLPSAPTANCLAYVPGTEGTYVLVGGGFDGDVPGCTHTKNNGDTWTTLDAEKHNALDFLSPTVGWAGSITSSTNGGMHKWTGTLLVPPLAVEHRNNLPTHYALEQNYPNPFNPSTTIRYQIPATSHVTLVLFDLLGREVATLVDAVEEPGRKSVTLDVSNLASGVYMYRLKVGLYVETKKLMVLR